MDAFPLSYSKTCDTFRPRAARAARTGLGRKRFIDLIEPYACVIALVPKHGPERRPARVEHRLAVLSFREGRSIHVADKDCTVLASEPAAGLMQKVLPAVRDPGVDRLHPALPACSLGSGERGFEVAVEALRVDIGKTFVREAGKGLEPEVDSQIRVGFIGPGRLHLDRHVQIPAAAAVLGDATGAELIAGQAIAVPDANMQALKVGLTMALYNRAGFEWNPSQRASRAGRATPSKLYLAVLFAARRVLFGDLLKHGRANRQAFFRGPVQITLELNARGKAPLAAKDLERQVIAIVPDEVHSPRHPGKRRSMPVLDSYAQNSNWILATCHGSTHSGLAVRIYSTRSIRKGKSRALPHRPEGRCFTRTLVKKASMRPSSFRNTGAISCTS